MRTLRNALAVLALVSTSAYAQDVLENEVECVVDMGPQNGCHLYSGALAYELDGETRTVSVCGYSEGLCLRKLMKARALIRKCHGDVPVKVLSRVLSCHR